MAQIVNITSWSCATTDEDVTTSNAGWTKNTSTGAYGTGAWKVQKDVSPISIYASSTFPTAGYLCDSVPASANQTVKATIKNSGSLTFQHIYLAARMSSGGDDWIGLAYVGSDGADFSGIFRIMKCVNGTISQVGSNVTSVGSLGSGATAEMKLVVTGTSGGGITATGYWNTVQKIQQTGITDSQLDGPGRVGFFNRVDGSGSSTGLHFTTFYAEDDSGSSQVLLPNSDVTTTGWTASDAGALYAALDEAAPGTDTEYIYTTTINAECEVALADGVTPATGTRLLKIKTHSALTPAGGMVASLVEGTNVVQAFTVAAPVAASTYAFTVTGAVTDYGNLRVRVKSVA